MEWMEAIKPGSSDYLQRFSKSGSLRRTISPQGPLPGYDPYSLAGLDPSVNNGNHQESVDVRGSWQSVGEHSADSIPPQPMNYMMPVSKVPGRSPHPQAERSHSEAAVVVEDVATHNMLASSANGRLQWGSKHITPPKDQPTLAAPVNPRQAPHRSTIAHFEREHKTTNLSRSKTEKQASRNQEHKLLSNNNSEHLYELDANSLSKAAKPPLPDRSPPKAKPRGSRQPTARNLSASVSDTQVSHSKAVSPGEVEPRYVPRPNSRIDTISKEPEYPISSESIPREGVKPAPEKPPITPRRTVGHPKQPCKQPEYLELDGCSNLADEEEQVLNGSVKNPPRVSDPGLNAPSVSSTEEMVRNFTPDQLGMLISMFQQVQSDGQQPAVNEVATGTEQGANSAHIGDHNQMRNNFGEQLSYPTPSP